MPTFLYNCKHSGDQFRITKFTTDLDPIPDSSYLTTLTECDCPAGHRDTCRHRQMLSRFINHGATSGQAFHNFEKNTWLQAAGVFDEPDDSGAAGAVVNETSLLTIETMISLPDDASSEDVARAFAELGSTVRPSKLNIDLGPGINLLDLANPLETHNAIAEALGEPLISLTDGLAAHTHLDMTGDLRSRSQLPDREISQPPTPESGSRPSTEFKRRV